MMASRLRPRRRCRGLSLLSALVAAVFVASCTRTTFGDEDDSFDAAPERCWTMRAGPSTLGAFRARRGHERTWSSSALVVPHEERIGAIRSELDVRYAWDVADDATPLRAAVSDESLGDGVGRRVRRMSFRAMYAGREVRVDVDCSSTPEAPICGPGVVVDEDVERALRTERSVERIVPLEGDVRVSERRGTIPLPWPDQTLVLWFSEHAHRLGRVDVEGLRWRLDASGVQVARVPCDRADAWREGPPWVPWSGAVPDGLALRRPRAAFEVTAPLGDGSALEGGRQRLVAFTANEAGMARARLWVLRDPPWPGRSEGFGERADERAGEGGRTVAGGGMTAADVHRVIDALHARWRPTRDPVGAAAVHTGSDPGRERRASEGDCRALSDAFVRDLGDAGIAATRVEGIAWDGARWTGHAWVEVQFADRTIAVDPTWRLVPAPLSHLRLRRGAGAYPVWGHVEAASEGHPGVLGETASDDEGER